MLDGGCNDWVNLRGEMRIVSICSVVEPFWEIEVCWSIQENWVAVVEIGDEGVVAVGSELVCHQLTVGPNTYEIM